MVTAGDIGENELKLLSLKLWGLNRVKVTLKIHQLKKKFLEIILLTLEYLDLSFPSSKLKYIHFAKNLLHVPPNQLAT